MDRPLFPDQQVPQHGRAYRPLLTRAHRVQLGRALTQSSSSPVAALARTIFSSEPVRRVGCACGGGCEFVSPVSNDSTPRTTCQDRTLRPAAQARNCRSLVPAGPESCGGAPITS